MSWVAAKAANAAKAAKAAKADKASKAVNFCKAGKPPVKVLR